MSTNNNFNNVYGLSQPIVNTLQEPIITNRAPTGEDKAQIGSRWINKSANNAYILTSVVNNVAHWEEVGGAGFAITFDTDTTPATPSAGVIDIAGGSNINTSGATNVVTINLDNTVSISGSMTAGTGFTATTGNVTVTAGDVNIAAGLINLPASSATAGIINLNGSIFMSGYNASNTFLGTNAGETMTDSALSGNENVGIGEQALQLARTARLNVALGWQSLPVLLGGLGNISIGYQAGTNYTAGESGNILIGGGVLGTTGENNTTRIGTGITSCFISGISGATVTGATVLCDTNGQLGTISSSIKIKENVQDILDYSEILYSLRPVVFNYKKEENKFNHYGLIAEEVAEVFPDLVLYDDKEEPYSVAYHEMYALLLNEIQRLNARLKRIENKFN